MIFIFLRRRSEIHIRDQDPRKDKLFFILIYGVLGPFEVGFIIRTVVIFEEACCPPSSGIKLIQRDRLVKLAADSFKEDFTEYLFKLGESFLAVAVDVETSHGIEERQEKCPKDKFLLHP